MSRRKTSDRERSCRYVPRSRRVKGISVGASRPLAGEPPAAWLVVAEPPDSGAEVFAPSSLLLQYFFWCFFLSAFWQPIEQ